MPPFVSLQDIYEMDELFYDEARGGFSFWNLTRYSKNFSEDRLFLVCMYVIPSGGTDLFCRGVTLTISAVIIYVAKASVSGLS